MPKVIAFFAIIAVLLAVFYCYSSSLNSSSFAGVKQNISDNVVGANPGDILHSEQLPENTLPNANVWKIWYVSTDFQTGEPIEVSGAVFVPKNRSGKLPVVAWAHGTSGIAQKCAMSFLPEAGAAKIPGLQDFINNGYVVVATDYPGLGTPGKNAYLVGNSEGYAVLDSVKALQKMQNLAVGNKFVVWGHSQGGHAALFTSQLAKVYAPKLELVGVVATAPATDLAKLLKLDIGTVAGNALASLAFVSWSNVYEGADLSQILNPLSIPVAKNIADHCLVNTQSDWEDIPEGLLLKLDFVSHDPTKVQPWANILRENTPNTNKNNIPYLITQGTADPVVNPEVTKQFVNNLCKNKNIVEYQELIGVSHLPAGFDSVSTVVPWVKERFAGKNAPVNCPHN